MPASGAAVTMGGVEPVKSNTRRQRGVLATVLALPLVAGVATWGIADGWFDGGAAVVQRAGDGGTTIGDVPELPALVGGVPSVFTPLAPATPAPLVSPLTGSPSAPAGEEDGPGDPAVPAAPGPASEEDGVGGDADPGEAAGDTGPGSAEPEFDADSGDGGPGDTGDTGDSGDGGESGEGDGGGAEAFRSGGGGDAEPDSESGAGEDAGSGDAGSGDGDGEDGGSDED